MPAPPIDAELAQSLERASDELMVRVREALRVFHVAPPIGWTAWETRRSPRVWETRVLPNLEKSHRNLQAALRRHQMGDIRGLTQEAASYAGLSHDLEFDMAWMTAQHRTEVADAVERVVMIADRIHRLGYAALSGSDQG